MKLLDHYVGQRLSLSSQTCTVRYIGPVADKLGHWLGVEWDYASRGKHNGTHESVIYFQCRSKSSTAASFLRPSQLWDHPRTFLEALREKYMPEIHESDAQIVYISGKQAEEIGFKKFHQRQAKLLGIHVLVLDHKRIKHQNPDPEDDRQIAQICADITEVDLSGNLFETFDEIADLCRQLPKLKVLTLDGNRFSIDPQKRYPQLHAINTLKLSQTLLTQVEVNDLLYNTGVPLCAALSFLDLANNEYSSLLGLQLPQHITTIELSNNNLTALSDLGPIGCAALRTLMMLKRNHISEICANTKSMADLSLPIVELDLSYNSIKSFTFFDAMNTTSFPALKHLRVTGNPVYKTLISAEGKSLTAEDGYMLTIARLPQLDYLNYSKITEKERLNAETYYLGQIAIEISNAREENEAEVIARHPRYWTLCEEYGEPTIRRKSKKGEIDPHSLAARLVMMTFHLAPNVLPNLKLRSWTEEMPKSFTIYAVLGIVGKKLARMPLDLRLILETDERDPVGRDSGYAGPEWWDSSDDEADQGLDDKLIRREVEMVAGTRALGTFVEGVDATVRIEMRSRSQ